MTLNASRIGHNAFHIAGNNSFAKGAIILTRSANKPAMVFTAGNRFAIIQFTAEPRPEPIALAILSIDSLFLSKNLFTLVKFCFSVGNKPPDIVFL